MFFLKKNNNLTKGRFSIDQNFRPMSHSTKKQFSAKLHVHGDFFSKTRAQRASRGEMLVRFPSLLQKNLIKIFWCSITHDCVTDIWTFWPHFEADIWHLIKFSLFWKMFEVLQKLILSKGPFLKNVTQISIKLFSKKTINMKKILRLPVLVTSFRSGP